MYQLRKSVASEILGFGINSRTTRTWQKLESALANETASFRDLSEY
jgi:hypothetical protein